METSKKYLGFINTQSIFSSIVGATIITGVLDAIAAIIVYGIFYKYNPIQIYQFVSSALLGADAYKGGIPIAFLGLFFHFIIAFAASFIFIQLYAKWAFLRNNVAVIGLLYGLVIWLVMNKLVIPFTKIPASPFDVVAIIGIIWHMLLVGLPIALIADKHFKSRS